MTTLLIHKVWLNRAHAVFEVAGFDGVQFREIPNGYCPPAHSCTLCIERPWLMVKTQWGEFKFGWRKRVLMIEWDETSIDVNGELLFKGDDVTKYARGVHAWGYVKAAEYLERLRLFAERKP